MVGELVDTGQEKNLGGAPTKYTQEIADKICAMITEGCSIRTICAKEGMPCAQTFFNWLRAHKEFLEQYTHAKQEQAEALIEDMLDIADDGTNDYTKNDEGYIANGEHIQRSRLRIETRKWLASKLKPKKYGEKVDLTSNGKEINFAVKLGDLNADDNC